MPNCLTCARADCINCGKGDAKHQPNPLYKNDPGRKRYFADYYRANRARIRARQNLRNAILRSKGGGTV